MGEKDGPEVLTCSSKSEKTQQELSGGDSTLPVDVSAGDVQLVPEKVAEQIPETEKVIRPKQFGVLSRDEENLIKFCQECHVEQARAILKNKTRNKVRVDCLDDSGTTPLEHACYKGNVELVELLLAAGADVNNNMQVQGYTPLMFAALAGKTEVVRILLRHGARTSAVNSIGRTASQLAGFVGQSQIAIMISNFFTLEDLNYYTVPQGLEKEPKLPPAISPTLHRFIMQTNLHPVKLIYFLRTNPLLLDESASVLRTMEAITEKEMKAREMNEIMGMKIHYLSCVLNHVKRSLADGKSFDDMLKLFVRGRNAQGFPEYLEKFLRESIRAFPFYQTPLHTTMVHAIAKANLGGVGGSMSILEQSINGQHMGGRDGPPCETCVDPDAKKKCASCKMVAYCNEECQKLHWPVHKKDCSDLAKQYILMQKRKAEEEEKERTDQQANGKSTGSDDAVPQQPETSSSINDDESLVKQCEELRPDKVKRDAAVLTGSEAETTKHSTSPSSGTTIVESLSKKDDNNLGVVDINDIAVGVPEEKTTNLIN